MTTEPAQPDDDRAKHLLVTQHRDIIRLQAENRRLKEELADQPLEQATLLIVWGALGAGWPLAAVLYVTLWGVDVGAVALVIATVAYFISLIALII